MKKIVEVLIIIVFTLSLLIVAELVLRVIFPVSPNPDIRDCSDSLAFSFNEKYLLTPKPFSRKAFLRQEKDGGGIVHWQVNSQGFRGPELRSDQEYRIFVYGDSNILARFSEDKDTFPRKLEKKLVSDTGRTIEVVNAGVIGFGPDQSLLKMTDELPRFHPNLVVFHVFADNDFGDLIRNRLFALAEQGKLVLTRFPRRIDRLFDLQQKLYRNKPWWSTFRLVWAAGKIRAFAEHSESPSVEQEINSSLALCKNEFEVYRQGREQTYSILADHYDYDLALDPNSFAANTKIKLMENILRQARLSAQAAHVGFVVLIQPSKKDLTTQGSPNYQNFSQTPSYRRNLLTQAVEQICRRQQIPFLNLYNSFLENKPDPDSLYLSGKDDHWNEAGQDLAATLLGDYIQTHADELGFRNF